MSFGSEIERITELMEQNYTYDNLPKLRQELAEMNKEVAEQKHTCLEFRQNKYSQEVECVECGFSVDAYDIVVQKFLAKRGKDA